MERLEMGMGTLEMMIEVRDVPEKGRDTASMKSG
jgi:hypothetical protein